MALPIDKGDFSWLAVNHQGELLYVRRPLRGSHDKSAIKILNMLKKDQGNIGAVLAKGKDPRSGPSSKTSGRL